MQQNVFITENEETWTFIFRWVISSMDRLCGLVFRVPGYRSRGPGSIPGATRFSEKKWVWNRVHSGVTWKKT
jgi:hypothetical protein